MTVKDVHKLIRGSSTDWLMVDGGWATDRHWIVPAGRVAGLLDAFNLEGVAGRYEVGAKVSYLGELPADQRQALARLLDPALYVRPLSPLVFRKRQAEVYGADVKAYLSVFVDAADDERHVFIRSDFLKFIGIEGQALRQADPEKNGVAPVGVFSEAGDLTAVVCPVRPW